MAISYLSAVNQVLIRLRETPVTSVSATAYSQLIGALINDAKREVEDSWQWSWLQDTISFSTSAGQWQYDLVTVPTDIRGIPATDRSRLFIDPQSTQPWLVNTTAGYEFQLRNEASFTDQAIKFAMVNQNAVGPPGSWQLIESPGNLVIPFTTDSAVTTDSAQTTDSGGVSSSSTFSPASTVGLWNKRALVFQIPDKVYNLKLYIINPQADLVADTDIMLCPTAPVVLKAYLFALYERGEELGEMLTLTTDKVEQSLSDAIAYDQSNTSTYLGFSVPTGAQY